ncbi:MAG: ABC transporter ATP-binding protein [Actinobacteria bacterium]|nr:ABC transporter ATP-binding protein [Actinomycetota bacterium]
MSKKIEFINLKKKYGEINALNNINYFINEREFFVIFGPSGAGKTTTLKIIAGLELPSSGGINIDNKPTASMSPKDRNVRMVFENYALYPHLTVFENIASPLRANRFSKKDISGKVNSIASTLGIREYLGRLPRELSGGQKQRVSLGRALVIKSDIYLLDEPLAHLDAKIRNELRAEFQNIKSFLSKSTVIYVTHDYLEALALGERICVMDKGEVIQIGNPEEIYYYPVNTFVAQTVGQPEISLLNLDISYKNGFYFLTNHNIDIKLSKRFNNLLKRYNKNKIIFGCRPQFWDFSKQEVKENDGYLKTEVQAFEIRNFKGVILTRVNSEQIIILCKSFEEIKEKEALWVKPDEERIYLFDVDTGDNLLLKNI